MGLFDFYQNWTNKRELQGLKNQVFKVNALEQKVRSFEDDDFKEKIKSLKKDVQRGRSLDSILPFVFALVREASRRTIGQRHFDEQIMGGIILSQGKIAEMKTGEGKTLAATLPLTLKALEGKGCHLVTVNDYLARRDASWMGPIYNFLGLSVGVIQQQGGAFVYDPDYGQEEETQESTVFVDVEHLRPASRKQVYQSDITYGTNNEFGFDYLRDNMARSKEQMAQRSLHYAIIDEVDSVLIDEARTPLIISAPAEEAEDLYIFFANLVKGLKEGEDYELDEKERAANLTAQGIAKVEQILGLKNLYDPLATKKYGGAVMLHYLFEALQAKALYHKDKDYIVKDGRVIIVDEFTGRLMPDRRYSEGLHQAIEAKEGVKIRQENLTLATISFQNYFRLYDSISGMTGTAATEIEEFRKIYNLDVIVIPTHKPMVRADWSDRIYKTEDAKFEAVVSEIKKRNKIGQPLLVGTLSIEKSERLSRMLKREGIKHQVLNAKHHEKEAKIIAKAGQKYAVTIATNMAGRGVDIILGKGVKEVGGLCVIGTERHEARRIDNQLRGRSGRQGDPGESIFFVSLEDDLMRIFGGERIKNLMTALHIPEDQPIESRLVSKGIESAQKKVESFNFDIRKHLLEFDDVLNKQRTKIYKERRQILDSSAQEIRAKILDSLKEALLKVCAFYSVDPKQAIKELRQIFPEEESVLEKIKNQRLQEVELFQILFEKAKLLFEQKEKEFSKIWLNLMRELYLSIIDSLWVDHLTIMDNLRQSVGLRGYGQRDPLLEYKKEGFRLFNELKDALEDQLARVVLKVVPRLPEEEEKQLIYQAPTEKEAAGTFENLKAGSKPEPVEQLPVDTSSSEPDLSLPQTANFKIGRNELCPCGSGKKYKKCHLDKPIESEKEYLFHLYLNNPKDWEKQTGLKVKVKR